MVRDSESPGLAPSISAAKARIVCWSRVYSRSRVGRPIPCRLRVAACALDSGIVGGGGSPSSPRISRSKSSGKLLVRSASESPWVSGASRRTACIQSRSMSWRWATRMSARVMSGSSCVVRMSSEVLGRHAIVPPGLSTGSYSIVGLGVMCRHSCRRPGDGLSHAPAVCRLRPVMRPPARKDASDPPRHSSDTSTAPCGTLPLTGRGRSVLPDARRYDLPDHDLQLGRSRSAWSCGPRIPPPGCGGCRPPSRSPSGRSPGRPPARP